MNSLQEQSSTTVLKNLHQLVGLAAGNSMPTAVQRNSFIVNEVSREFEVAADEKVLSNVLDSLLNTVVSHSKHSCIRIEAKEYEDVIFVSVRDTSTHHDYAVQDQLDQVKQLAKELNGTVSFNKMEDKWITILLSFPNFPKAA